MTSIESIELPGLRLSRRWSAGAFFVRIGLGMAGESEPLIGTTELARRLNVHPYTIQKWAKSGKIRAIRISPTALRFDFQQVLAVLAANPDGAAPPPDTKAA